MNKKDKTTREELLKSPEYYITRFQISVYNMLDREKARTNATNEQLAKQLNISVNRIKQIFDGEYDGKASQLIQIALKLGYTPEFRFYHPIFSET